MVGSDHSREHCNMGSQRGHSPTPDASNCRQWNHKKTEAQRAAPAVPATWQDVASVQDFKASLGNREILPSAPLKEGSEYGEKQSWHTGS